MLRSSISHSKIAAALLSMVLYGCVPSNGSETITGQVSSDKSETASSEMFPFALPLNVSKDSAIDLRSMNDLPAGSRGRIITRDGHFVHSSDGSRIRFWGINVGGPELFASSQSDITKVAERLAKFGFNLVRLHHLDNVWDISSGRSLWDRNSEKRVIDPKNLDKLMFAIAEFKKQGIYVNLNTKVSKELTAADGLPTNLNTAGDWDQGFPHQKRVDRFSRIFIDHQKTFARQLWSSFNTYTGKKLSEDPCIAFAEINNENSLVSLWPGQPLGQDLEKLPKVFVDELKEKWNAWLKGRYQSQPGLLAAWGGASLKLGQPVTKAANQWQHVFPGATAGTLNFVGSEASSSKPGVLRSVEFNVTKITGTDWHQQGIITNISLEKDKVYTLRFRGASKPARKMRISADLSSGDYRNVGLDQTIELTPEGKDYDLTFTTRNPSDSGGNRLAVHLGGAAGTVKIEDLVLLEGSSQPLLGEGMSLENANIDINPMLNKAARNDWIAFLADTDRIYSSEMRKLFRDELGIQSLLTDSQVQWGGTTGFQREQDSDFMDTHAYFCHPDFGSGAWNPVNWKVDQKSWIQEYANGSGTSLADLAAYRVAGMPFSVSEYDHPAPNEYRAEMYPVTAVVAALQDWDAIYAFAHGGWSEVGSPGKINGFFDNAFDPAKFCFAPSAAILFRNGLVAPVSQLATLQLPRNPWEVSHTSQAIWENATKGKIDPITTRYSIDRGVFENVGSRKETADGTRFSKLEKKPNGAVLVTSNKDVFVASGFLGGASFEFSDGTIECETFPGNFGSLMLVPLDGKPLASSKRLLLTVLAKAENTNMKWNADRSSVGDQWGKAPSVVLGIPGKMTWKNPIATVAPLQPDGSRSASIGSGQSVSFTPKHRTVWYEFAR